MRWPSTVSCAISIPTRISNSVKEMNNAINPNFTLIVIFGPIYSILLNRGSRRSVNSQRKWNVKILDGLCVGHDSLFFKYSEAFTTVLIARDSVLGHNRAIALYASAPITPDASKGVLTDEPAHRFKGPRSEELKKSARFLLNGRTETFAKRSHFPPALARHYVRISVLDF